MIRVHKTLKTYKARMFGAEVEVHKTVCGERFNPRRNFVTDDNWQNVTCLKCLAKRP